MPLQDVAESGEAINSIANPQALRVLVFPGADGSFVMREDRGTWGAPSADTAIAFTWGGADASPSAFTVAPVTGDTSAVPELRDWTVVFRGVAPVDAASGVRAWSGEAPVEATVAYDEATMSLTVSVTGISSAASLRIEIPGGLRIADNPVESDAMDLLLHAQMLYRTKELALQAVHKLGIGAIGALRTMNRGPRYANDFWITDMPDAVAGCARMKFAAQLQPVAVFCNIQVRPGMRDKFGMVAEGRGIPGAVRGMAFAIALIVRSVERNFSCTR